MLLLEKSQKQVGPVLDIIARLTVCPFDRENRASGALFLGNAMPFSKPAGNTRFRTQHITSQVTVLVVCWLMVEYVVSFNRLRQNPSSECLND